MNELEAFLGGGFDAVPANRLSHLASDAKDQCYATGDVRYCIASDCLDVLASCWGDDGAVRQSVVSDLQQFVLREFGPAMSEVDAETSRILMVSARSTLLTILGSAGDLVYG